MRFVSFLKDDKKAFGILKGDLVYKVASSCPDLDTYIKDGISQTEEEIISFSEPIHISDVKLLSPFTNDMHILCVGLNYQSHANEFRISMDTKIKEDESIYFIKRVHKCLGHKQNLISRLDLDPMCDYETELGVVIAKELEPGSEIDNSVIFGLTIINDFTSRGIQRKYKQWALGKSFDTYCAMGPSIVTLDECQNYENLAVKGYLNNKLVQDSNTALLRKGILDIIKDLNQGMTLHRGDVIATGTPAGVAVAKEDMNAFLKKGDVFRCEIENIGILENLIT